MNWQYIIVQRWFVILRACPDPEQSEGEGSEATKNLLPTMPKSGRFFAPLRRPLRFAQGRLFTSFRATAQGRLYGRSE